MRRRIAAPPSNAVVGSLIVNDPPRHTQLRALINRAFTPRTVTLMKPRIEAIAAELLHAVAGTGRLDLVADFAYPLPVIVIAEMLGIPAADRDKFKHWSDEVVAKADAVFGGTSSQSRATDQEMFAYFREIIAERRRAPREDLISMLLAAETDGEQLSEADACRSAGCCWWRGTRRPRT